MSFVLNFFRNILRSIGLWKINAKIVFLGLDNAGKTTLLTVLKHGKVTQMPPTKHAHSEELSIQNVNIHAFDLGGHNAMRKVWRDYFPDISAVVYLVDAADPERFEESRLELDKLLNNEEIGNIPVLILGNKIDKKEAVDEEEFRLALGLATQSNFGVQKLDNIGGKTIEVFMCSVARKMGFKEGLDWLTQKLKK